MKSYIQHLNSQPKPAFAITGVNLVSSDIQSKRSKRREFERSMSDPLLLEPVTAQRRRRGERRGLRKTQIKQADAPALTTTTNDVRPTIKGRHQSMEKANSMSDVLTASKSLTNAARPTRRGSIVEDQPASQAEATTTQPVANVARANRRDSMAKMKSCSDLRNSQKNLVFRANILYKALDDMGLFDEEEETIPATSIFQSPMAVI